MWNDRRTSRLFLRKVKLFSANKPADWDVLRLATGGIMLQALFYREGRAQKLRNIWSSLPGYRHKSAMGSGELLFWECSKESGDGAFGGSTCEVVPRHWCKLAALLSLLAFTNAQLLDQTRSSTSLEMHTCTDFLSCSCKSTPDRGQFSPLQSELEKTTCE